MARTITLLVYSRKITTTLANGRKTAVTITRRYPIDSGCLKFGRTPGGGGKIPVASSIVANGIGFAVSLFCKRTERLSNELSRVLGSENGICYGTTSRTKEYIDFSNPNLSCVQLGRVVLNIADVFLVTYDTIETRSHQ